MTKFEEMKKENGLVNFDGKEYALTQDAYADNYQDRVCYFANAIDADGREFKVRWETTSEWDEREEKYNRYLYLSDREESEEEKAELEELIKENWDMPNEDESLACDWENPVEAVER